MSANARPRASIRLMYEPANKPLISHRQFVFRVVSQFGKVTEIIAGALMIGVLGYHFVAGLPWIDSLLNASMILGGMGPVDPLKTVGAKLFASAFALFSGLVFIALAAVIIAPFAHRLLHYFRLADDDDDFRRQRQDSEPAI